MKNRYTTSQFSSKKKYLLPLLAIVTVLAICSSATFAWIVSNTNPVVNQFKLLSTDMDLQEEFNGTIKENVAVKNTGEADIYVRINLVLQVVDNEGNTVANPVVYDENGNVIETPALTLANYLEFTGFDQTDWKEINGYYYYTKPVTANSKTTNLFTKATQKVYLAYVNNTSTSIGESGNVVTVNADQKLSLTVMAEAIQKNGVEDAWVNVNLDENGNIVKGGKN